MCILCQSSHFLHQPVFPSRVLQVTPVSYVGNIEVSWPSPELLHDALGYHIYISNRNVLEVSCHLQVVSPRPARIPCVWF